MKEKAEPIQNIVFNSNNYIPNVSIKFDKLISLQAVEPPNFCPELSYWNYWQLYYCCFYLTIEENYNV